MHDVSSSDSADTVVDMELERSPAAAAVTNLVLESEGIVKEEGSDQLVHSPDPFQVGDGDKVFFPNDKQSKDHAEALPSDDLSDAPNDDPTPTCPSQNGDNNLNCEGKTPAPALVEETAIPPSNNVSFDQENATTDKTIESESGENGNATSTVDSPENGADIHEGASNVTGVESLSDKSPSLASVPSAAVSAEANFGNVNGSSPGYVDDPAVEENGSSFHPDETELCDSAEFSESYELSELNGYESHELSLDDEAQHLNGEENLDLDNGDREEDRKTPTPETVLEETEVSVGTLLNSAELQDYFAFIMEQVDHKEMLDKFLKRKTFK